MYRLRERGRERERQKSEKENAYENRHYFLVGPERQTYFRAKQLFASRITRAKKSEAKRGSFPHNRGMNVLLYFSSKFNLSRPYLWPVSPLTYIPVANESAGFYAGRYILATVNL